MTKDELGVKMSPLYLVWKRDKNNNIVGRVPLSEFSSYLFSSKAKKNLSNQTIEDLIYLSKNVSKGNKQKHLKFEKPLINNDLYENLDKHLSKKILKIINSKYGILERNNLENYIKDKINSESLLDEAKYSAVSQYFNKKIKNQQSNKIK